MSHTAQRLAGFEFKEKNMGERLTVGEVCTRSVTIAFRRTTLTGAAKLMRENHVGSLVVVDETGGAARGGGAADRPRHRDRCGGR